MKRVESTTYRSYNSSGPVVQIINTLSLSEDFISDELGNMFRFVNLAVLSTLVALFGVCTNVINMTVFYRQGFSTTTNISFFALAISDLFCLLTAQWFAISLNPYLETAYIHFIPNEVQYLSGGWLHVCFSRITSWITVFITAERCLGITVPLKVKQIITLRRTATAMCFLFAINLATLLPEYVITYWGWKFVPAKNRSLLGIVYRSSYKDQGYGLVYTFTSISGIMSFAFVIFLTTFLVTKLAQKSRWRNSATGVSDSSDTVSTRDKKTMKMIIMIASVLIVCHISGTIVSLVTSFVSEFMIDRVFANSYFTFWGIAFLFDAVNSSVNIFLYYRMSTKYRLSFNELFRMCFNEDARSPEPSNRK